MSETKYLKMDCPHCKKEIDHVEYVVMDISEGSWRPVIIPKKEAIYFDGETKHAFGGSETVFTSSFLRCPKCKNQLYAQPSYLGIEHIAEIIHRLVTGEMK
jgi:phage FluMu protein Com